MNGLSSYALAGLSSPGDGTQDIILGRAWVHMDLAVIAIQMFVLLATAGFVVALNRSRNKHRHHGR